MIIAKFGGTSVTGTQRIAAIHSIVQNQLDKSPVIVVSALSGVTDLLLSLPEFSPAKQKKGIEKIKKLHLNLTREIWKQEKEQKEISKFIDQNIKEIKKLLKKKNQKKEFLDELASFGEILSSFIITKALESRGIKAKQVIAKKIIITNNFYGSAEFLPVPTKKNLEKKVLPLIKGGIVPVITGFIGSTVKGKTTTLGRGGSDYTASIVGFCLNASEIQIWTDVDGMFTADPRIIKKAKLIPVISYREASELATFGARVLHPRTIKPAIKSGIPVRVLNSFNIKSKGTLIVKKACPLSPLTAVSFKKKITLVNIYSISMLLSKGFLAKIFEVFSKNNISIDLVSVSEVSVSVTLDNEDNLKQCISELSEIASVTVTRNLGLISLIGERIVDSSYTTKMIFDLLDREKILVKMVTLGATDINISLVINNQDIEKALKVLHDKLLIGLYPSPKSRNLQKKKI